MKEGGYPPASFLPVKSSNLLSADVPFIRKYKGYERLIWNEENQSFAREIFKGFEKRKNWHDYVPKSSNKVLNHEFIILQQKLLTYMRFCGKAKIIPEDCYTIMKRNLLEGPYYAMAKKKSYDYSIRETIALTYVRTPEEVETFSLKEGIDKFFPSRHLIHWEIPIDYSDIIDNSFSPADIKIDLARLEERMGRFLKKNVNLRNFDILDTLQECSTKVAFDHYKGKSKACDLRTKKGLPCDLEEDYLRFKISWTTKNPDEPRLISIADLPTRNLIKISREATEQITNCPHDKYGKSRWDFSNFLRQDFERYFILLDQTKSGWTFPMELMASFFKICQIFYPDFEPFKIMYKMFNEKRVIYDIEGQERCPLRGFVLGMFDNVMSFIISCIFDMFLEDVKDDLDFQDMKITGMFWGDDQVIRLERCKENLYLRFWNMWIYKLLQYAININRKKSIASKQGIFCEVYTDNSAIPLQKTLVYLLMPFDSLRGCCTLERKILWSAYSDLILRAIPWFNCWTDFTLSFATQILTDIQALIGWEFCEYEKNLPFHLGGWNLQRDSEGNIAILEFLWENFTSVPSGFINVGYDNPTLGKFFKPTKDYKKLMKDQYFNELLQVLDSNILYYNPSTSLKSKFLNLNLGLSVSETKKKKLWIKTQSARQRSFRKKTIRTQSEILYKFFSEGVLKGPIKRDYLVRKPISQLVFFLEQEKAKKEINISKERCLFYLSQRLGLGFYGVKYLRDNFISFKEIVANLFYEISSSNKLIPADWFVWSLRTGQSLEKLQQSFWQEYNENIFDYNTPLSMKDDEVLKRFGFKETDTLTWDNEYGIVHPLDEMDVISILNDDFSQKQKLFAEKLGLSESEYLEKATYRSARKTFDDDNIDDELDQINLMIKKPSSSSSSSSSDEDDKPEEPTFNFSGLAVTNIMDIEDMDDDEEEENPPDDEDLDPLTAELRRLGLDTVDVYDLGELEGFYGNPPGDPEEEEE